MTTRPFCDDLVGFRVDLDPGRGTHGGAITLASDYEPMPLSFLDLGQWGADPEAALDALAPRLRRAARMARPANMRAHARVEDATLRLHAAIVKAPLIARERTSAAEIAGHLSRWREITTFGWQNLPGEDPHRSAYQLLGRLEIGC
jgi:hypothetical protein